MIKTNPKAKNDKDFMVAKILDNKKMSDIGVRNDEGTNIIFHTNKKNISQFAKFKREAQILVETPSAKAAPTWSDHCADNPQGSPKCDKAPSISANETIPQNTDKKANKKVFSKNPQSTPKSRSKLQTKMSAVANKDKESKHTKTKKRTRQWTKLSNKK